MATQETIDRDEQAFIRQVTNQVQRATQELSKLELLLKAGMVERAVLEEFRHAVDQIRKTSWNVQQSLDGK